MNKSLQVCCQLFFLEMQQFSDSVPLRWLLEYVVKKKSESLS